MLFSNRSSFLVNQYSKKLPLLPQYYPLYSCAVCFMGSINAQLVYCIKMEPAQPQPSLPVEGRRIKLSPVCTNCREKHLRCDGAPQCSRCRRNGSECIFVPSRRGMRPNKTPSTRSGSGVLDDTLGLGPSVSGPSTVSSISSSPSPHGTLRIGVTGSRSLSSARQIPNLPAIERVNTVNTADEFSSGPSDRLIDLFYSRFLSAQQFVIPKQLLLERQSDPAIYFLKQVIEYIGSSYSSLTLDLRNRVPDPTALSQRLPKNAYTVQALLILALWFENLHQPVQYIRHLNQARACALAIRMDHLGFAGTNSEHSQQLELSWSATWQAVVRMCQPASFTADQQLQLPIEGQHATRRMTTPLPMAVEPQTWDWTYTEPSAYAGFELIDTGQLSAQSHPQSMPAIYETSNSASGHSNVAFQNLPLTTTWEGITTPVTAPPDPNITPWNP